MPVSGLAPFSAPVFDPISVRSKPRVEMHELLALLKVRTIHAMLVTLLVVVQYTIELASSLSQQPRLLFEVFFGMFAWDVGFYIVGFAIIAVVQTRFAPGRWRTIMLLSAVLVWVLLWTLLHVLEADSHFIVVELGLVSSASVTVHGLWTNTTYLLLAAWYYESADYAKQTSAALRASELARRHAERWLLELRLGTLQARLDPQVLFDTLDEAGRLYRSRPAAAEQLLDVLIDYLRRALPQLRQPESTVGREVALALAYARVLRSRDGEPIDLETIVRLAVSDVCFPPMVVQPLCDALARPALASGEPVRMRISAEHRQDCVHLELIVQPLQTAPSRERIAEVRHTLLGMFGPAVRMEATGPTVGVFCLIVEVPDDAAPRIDS